MPDVEVSGAINYNGVNVKSNADIGSGAALGGKVTESDGLTVGNFVNYNPKTNLTYSCRKVPAKKALPITTTKKSKVGGADAAIRITPATLQNC